MKGGGGGGGQIEREPPSLSPVSAFFAALFAALLHYHLVAWDRTVGKEEKSSVLGSFGYRVSGQFLRIFYRSLTFSYLFSNVVLVSK